MHTFNTMAKGSKDTMQVTTNNNSDLQTEPSLLTEN